MVTRSSHGEVLRAVDDVPNADVIGLSVPSTTHTVVAGIEMEIVGRRAMLLSPVQAMGCELGKPNAEPPRIQNMPKHLPMDSLSRMAMEF